MMHLPHLEAIPEAAIAAIADPVAGVLSGVGDQYSVDRRFTDSRRLVEEAGDALDAVVIAAPPQTHAEAAIQALEADSHVLVEKPIALSIQDADRMITAAETADATAMVGCMKRHDAVPGDARARRGP